MSAAAAAAVSSAVIPTVEESYHAYGAIRAIFRHLMADNAPGEMIASGPAGTGKTRGLLEIGNWVATEYLGARILLIRKTRRSLTESALVTLEQKVLNPAQGVRWEATLQRYRYPNGSIIAVAGLDKASKVMSSEWDLILLPEATEVSESEWEALTTRLRNGKTPFQVIIGDCNPDTPTHWIRQRAEAGRLALFESRHEDNPTVTASYLAKLDELTGVRYLRLRKGLWAAAEGMIYADAWDAKLNIQPRAAISKRPGDLYGDCGIDPTWPRYLAIDFGFTERHPFVARWYAEDGEGALWMYREIYMTNRLVEDHAKDIRKYSRWGASPHGDPLPRAIICDHDAEGRATLERHLGLRTTAADKRVLEGIQVVASRMRPAGDGRPRLYYLRDALVERDRVLVDAKRPTCGAEEVESYVWKLGGSGRRDEVEKDNDHAMDADRYLCMYRDMRAQSAKMGARLF